VSSATPPSRSSASEAPDSTGSWRSPSPWDQAAGSNPSPDTPTSAASDSTGSWRSPSPLDQATESTADNGLPLPVDPNPTVISVRSQADPSPSSTLEEQEASTPARPGSSLSGREREAGSTDPRTPPDPPVPGDRIDGFVIVRPIGVGGMGAVYLAEDIRLERPVALKVLPPAHSRDADVVQRFYQEARAAAKLDHEHIARVHTIGHDGQYHYIAFEFIEGINLRQLVEENGPLPPATAIHYTLQVAHALAHASSRGVVHRDIKPSNIIVTTGDRAKLVDMGLARHFERGGDDTGGLTQSNMTLGTFDYISPEQARDPRTVDVRGDLYSLGCTLFHMLTGRPPFPEGTVLQKLLQHQEDPPPDPRAINPAVPQALAAVTIKLMAKDPARRHQTPEQLVRDLREVAATLGLRVGEGSEGLVVPQAGSEVWGRALAWTVPVVGLLVLLLALVGFDRNAARTVPDDGLEAIGLGDNRIGGPMSGVAPKLPPPFNPVAPDPTGPRAGLIVIELNEELIDLPTLLKERSAATIELVLTRLEPYRWKRSNEPIDLKGRHLRLRPDPNRAAGNRPVIRLDGGAVLRDGWVRMEGVEWIREPRLDAVEAALRGNGNANGNANAARGEPLGASPALRLDDGRLELINCLFRTIDGDADPNWVAVELRATRSTDSSGLPSRQGASGLILECEFGSAQRGLRLIGPVTLTIRDSQFLGLAPAVIHRPWFGSFSNVSGLAASLASGDPTSASAFGSARIELTRVVIQPRQEGAVGNDVAPSPVVFDLGGTVPVLELSECRVEAGPYAGRLVLVRTDDPAGPLWRGVRNLYVGLARFLDGSQPNAPRIDEFDRWRDPSAIPASESGTVALTLNPRWEVESQAVPVPPHVTVEAVARNDLDPPRREEQPSPRQPLANPSPSLAAAASQPDPGNTPRPSRVGPPPPPPTVATNPTTPAERTDSPPGPASDRPSPESAAAPSGSDRPLAPVTTPQGSLGLSGLNLGEGPAALRLPPPDAVADRERPNLVEADSKPLPTPAQVGSKPKELEQPVAATNSTPTLTLAKPEPQPAEMDVDMMELLDQLGQNLNRNDTRLTSPNPSPPSTTRDSSKSEKVLGEPSHASNAAVEDSNRDPSTATIRDGRDLFRAIAAPRTRAGERILRLAAGPLSTSGFEFKGTGRLILAPAAEAGMAANRSDAQADPNSAQPRPILVLEQGEAAPRALDGFALPRGLIHVQAGELILQGVEVRLSIDREGRPGIAVPFSVAPGASLRLEDCLVTIAHAEETAVIGLIPADASITMVDSDPAPARVAIQNCLIRGGGDLFNLPSGVGLRAELSQVALAGSATLLNARGVPRDDPIPEIKLSLNRVTTLTRGPLIQVITQSAQPEPPFVEVEVVSSLVTTTSATTPLVRLVAADDSNPFRRRFNWIGRGVGYHQIQIYRRDEIPVPAEVDPNLMIEPVETAITTDWTQAAWSQTLGESDRDALHGDLGLITPPSDARSFWAVTPADLERPAEARGSDRGADPKRLPAVGTQGTGTEGSTVAPR